MPKIYGLIGYPLSHSFSRQYFEHKFSAEKIDAEYLNFELEDIGQLMEVFAEYPTLSGLNVTRPYKEQIIPYMDEMSVEAQRIGAVNVVRVKRGADDADIRLIGCNTDVYGFRASVAPLLSPLRRRALVLGTGGASKAVNYALHELGVSVTEVSRTRREGVITYDDITDEVLAQHGLVVNTTPVGMYPHTDEYPPLPYHALTPQHLCYDLIYNPDTTLFMRRSAEHGAETKNGLEMLMLQAFASWDLWNEN